MTIYRNRAFNFGINSLDAEHQVGDNYCVIGKNVNVGAGYVQTRGGFELWNEGVGYNPAYLTGGASATSVVATWNAVTDGTFTIFINGVEYDITGLNFSTDTTMALIAARIQAAIRTATSSLETCVFETDKFIIRSVNITSASAITVTSAKGSGTDISGAGGTAFMDSETGRGTVTNSFEITGGIPMMTPAYFRGGTKFLVFANADHYYSLPNTATTASTWTDLGDYGTAVPNPYAIMHKNVMIFGTGLVGNTPKKWSGSGSIANITTPADTTNDLRFYKYFQGANIAYLLGGGNHRDHATNNNSTSYYAPDSDNWAGGGYVQIGDGDGQELTGIAVHSNIIFYKENSKYRGDVVIEPSTSVSVMRVLEKFNDGGSINHECIVEVLNDIVTMSNRKGDGVRGFSQQQTKLGGSESKRYSTKITPLTDQINRAIAKDTMRAIVFEEKLYIAAPLGAANYNNVIFVGHLNQTTDLGEPAWTIYNINAGSFAILNDENNKEMLLMGDSLSSKIYKWNENILSDNGHPISAQFRTKKVDMGDIGIDTYENILIAGEMTTPTEIHVKVYIDGKRTTYTITKEQIYDTNSLLWSHVIGSEIVGHNSVGSGFQKLRFVAILPIPDQFRDGAEVQVDLSSSGVGYWWKMDALMIIGEEDNSINLNLFPDNHWVSAN